jgi:predicted O-linked N-acetylglucosamine transferase (SPINDLY family)
MDVNLPGKLPAELPPNIVETPPSPAERALYLAFREHQAGQFEAAVDWYRRAVEIQPNFPQALNNLGIALKDLRRFEEALIAYREALALRPDSAEILNNIGDALHSLGDRQGAIQHYRRALAIRANYGIAWRNLGDALAELGKLEQADECFRRAVSLAPHLDTALSPTDIGLREIRHRFAQAVKNLETASARDPLFHAAYTACRAGNGPPAGCGETVAARYRLAANLLATYAGQLSMLLLAMHYEADVAPSSLREAHGEAERLFGELPRFTAHANQRDPERRLRIGYVSPDFRTHSVGYFLTAIFSAHDRAAVEIYCYSGCADEDEQTAFFKSHASAWRSTLAMSDERLAAAIREDGIDILVDLSGHTNGNRLAVFARRPAPVQATWLGYPNTTGLSGIDYRLTDAIIDPPGIADTLSSERLVRLPDGFLCYTAPAAAPDVAAPPATAAPVITFGSFNNLIKVNGAVLDAWTAILHRVPASRLLLKTKWLGLPGIRDHVHKQFEKRGIARDRIDLMGQQTSSVDHLALYGRVDIGLDTFPYNGATTTCEALWMGVPIVTLAGDRHAARYGVSLLTRAGLAEFVATSPTDYVETAARLAADRERLAVLRAGLRARLAASTLCDSVRITRRLEDAYRLMWREWCGSAG